MVKARRIGGVVLGGTFRLDQNTIRPLYNLTYSMGRGRITISERLQYPFVAFCHLLDDDIPVASYFTHDGSFSDMPASATATLLNMPYSLGLIPASSPLPNGYSEIVELLRASNIAYARGKDPTRDPFIRTFSLVSAGLLWMIALANANNNFLDVSEVTKRQFVLDVIEYGGTVVSTDLPFVKTLPTYGAGRFISNVVMHSRVLGNDGQPLILLAKPTSLPKMSDVKYEGCYPVFEDMKMYGATGIYLVRTQRTLKKQSYASVLANKEAPFNIPDKSFDVFRSPLFMQRVQSLVFHFATTSAKSAVVTNFISYVEHFGTDRAVTDYVNECLDLVRSEAEKLLEDESFRDALRSENDVYANRYRDTGVSSMTVLLQKYYGYNLSSLRDKVVGRV